MERHRPTARVPRRSLQEPPGAQQPFDVADDAVHRPPIARDEAVHRRQSLGRVLAFGILDHRPGGAGTIHDRYLNQTLPGGAFEPSRQDGLPDPPGLAVLPHREMHRVGDGTLSCSADVFHFPSSSGDAQARVVVPVPRPVPVAVRGPAIPRRVVPATAAIHAVRASFGQDPSMLSSACRRNALLSARRTNAKSGSTWRAVSSSLHRPLVKLP